MIRETRVFKGAVPLMNPANIMTTQSYTPAEYLDPKNLAARDELHRMGLEFLGLPVFYFEGQVTEIISPALDDNLLRLVREKLDHQQHYQFETSLMNITVRVGFHWPFDGINATPIHQLLAAMIAVGRVK